MRSKEEIALIADEIHRKVQRRIMADDAKRILKKYGPNCLSVVGLAACMPVVTLQMMDKKDYHQKIAEEFSIKKPE